MSERTIRASELGEFVFCRRAWWYAQSGVPSEARGSQDRGIAWHAGGSRRAMAAEQLAGLGRALIAAGVVLLAIYLILQFAS